MKLAVFSYKVVWRHPTDETFKTTGGFSHQMGALSEIFDETRLVVFLRPGSPPDGSTPLAGKKLSVTALSEPGGTGIARKLALVWWLPRNLLVLARSIRWSDAVHAIVPGDLGSIGLMLAVVARKPLFVRHCGTWNDKSTFANRCLAWMLPRIASARNVVLATGGGSAPPCSNPNVHWIFSTALSRVTLQSLSQAPHWAPPESVQIVAVGRLTKGKNCHSLVQAMRSIVESYPDARLHLVGEGPYRNDLETLVAALSLGDRVTLHGNLTQQAVLDRLQQAHLFVFPTRVREGFPKAVLEAMACGLPILAPPVSVLPHLLCFEDAERSCGFLLDPPEPEKIAEAVKSALEDPARLAQMGERARLAARRYSLEDWQETIHSLLRSAWKTPLQSR